MVETIRIPSDQGSDFAAGRIFMVPTKMPLDRQRGIVQSACCQRAPCDQSRGERTKPPLDRPQTGDHNPTRDDR